ncbi:hypothetical protein, partial [Sinorhizobium meliloti]|uniref:hypothetical protein n=1 Tax=Rhizobium meliloti TaxID=382 RepID=UPI001AECE4B9
MSSQVRLNSARNDRLSKQWFKFHNVDYLILWWCSRVHSISKCDMPIKTKASPWRFLDVAVLFAA